MPLTKLADTGQSIQPPPDVQRTTMSLDVLGRFVCSTWDEAVNNGGLPFDAINAADLQMSGPQRDSLGSTYHEGGTLWMGADPTSSVTDPNGRLHHVSNAYCADQSLFVTVGSVNPTLTGLTLARKVAAAVAAQAVGLPAPPPEPA